MNTVATTETMQKKFWVRKGPTWTPVIKSRMGTLLIAALIQATNKTLFRICCFQKHCLMLTMPHTKET